LEIKQGYTTRHGQPIFKTGKFSSFLQNASA